MHLPWVFDVSSSRNSRNLSLENWFHCYPQRHPPSNSSLSIIDIFSTPFFLIWLLREICDEQIPPRQGRSNPRFVKKTRSKFPAKKPFHRVTGTQHQHLNFSIASTA